MTISQYLKSYRALWGLGVAVVALGPLALWVPDLEPPWPEGSQLITTLFCVLVAILSFALGRQLAPRTGRRTRSRKNRSGFMLWLGSIAIVLGLGFSAYYLVAFERFVIFDQQTIGQETRQVRRVRGTDLLGAWRGTSETPLQLLREHGYVPEVVWTQESVLRIQFLLFATFALAFALFTFGLALLALIPS